MLIGVLSKRNGFSYFLLPLCWSLQAETLYVICCAWFARSLYRAQLMRDWVSILSIFSNKPNVIEKLIFCENIDALMKILKYCKTVKIQHKTNLLNKNSEFCINCKANLNKKIGSMLTINILWCCYCAIRWESKAK